MQYQIQEVLPAEHLSDADGIQEELDVYNALIPGGPPSGKARNARDGLALSPFPNGRPRGRPNPYSSARRHHKRLDIMRRPNLALLFGQSLRPSTLYSVVLP